MRAKLPDRVALPEVLAVFSGPLRVCDIMSISPINLDLEKNFADLVALMASEHFHHVLVVDADQRLHGVISDRDVLRALTRIKDWNTKTVSDVMTRDPVTTTPDSLISTAARELISKHINCLPVLGEDGLVCGIITSTDILKAYEKVQALVEKVAQ